MQNRNRLEKLSRLRSELDGLLRRLEQTLAVVFDRSPLIKGNVYELARKCGKRSCVCVRGQLHRSMVLSWSQAGKSRLLSLPADKLAEVRRKSAAYLRLRAARAQVSVLCQKMLGVIDRIQRLRQEAP